MDIQEAIQFWKDCKWDWILSAVRGFFRRVCKVLPYVRSEAEMMEKIVVLAIIIGASYGLVLLIGNLIVAGLKLYSIKSRRHRNGR